MRRKINWYFEGKKEHVPIFIFLLKWFLICSVVGLLTGSASALFLVSLDVVTVFRESHLWVVALLPLGGLMVGGAYHYLGTGTEKGNNLLIENIHAPEKIIPFKMAPLVLLGTLLTHVVGGSAGREGTAVQMGGAIADQFTRLFKLNNEDRKLLLIAGISGGFSSVFGTPLAGTVFALEVYLIGQMQYSALLPSLLSAVIAHLVTSMVWAVPHTHYVIGVVPEISFASIGWSMGLGIVFGATAFVFAQASHFFGMVFKSQISYPPLRPFVGGIILAVIFYLIYTYLGTTRYLGLGIPTIEASFLNPSDPYDFFLKLALTAFTLGCGFKGGEVTPLFYIGATLGSALSTWIPLPTGLMAAMGFAAVFSGAANTPIACIFLSVELFGIECGIYSGIACVVAFLFSGHTGIYGSQIVGSPKHRLFLQEGGHPLANIKKLRRNKKVN